MNRKITAIAKTLTIFPLLFSGHQDELRISIHIGIKARRIIAPLTIFPY
jgi:hypothetical protein